MHTDPAPYIIAAAILGGCIGFFGCALYASRRITDAARDAYWEGYGAANRDHEDLDARWHLTPHGERHLLDQNRDAQSSPSDH